MSGGERDLPPDRAADSVVTVGSQAPELVQRSRRTWARFPRRVYGVGTEPDPRFSLANERTFLAWIRTSLALVAGGIALEAVAVPISPPLRFGVALLLVSLGLAASVQAWFGWVRDERAIREGRPLGGGWLVGPLAAGCAAVAALLVVGLVIR